MAVFKLWKLTDKGTAEYRQEGSTVSFRCTAEGMFDGDAPKEIQVIAANLAAVEPKPKKAKAEPEPEPAKSAKSAKSAKGPKAKKGSSK
jgi:hypothetical protein